MRKPLTLESLNNTLGLSCIENHFIGLLRHYGVPYQSLFIESFVHIEETIDSFIKENKKYEYYDGIERVHLLAKQLGLARIDYIKDVPFNDLERMLVEASAKQMPLLVRVDHQSMNSNQAMVSWRNDHYVSIFNFNESNRTVTLLDDNPRKIENIHIDGIKDFYAGEVQMVSLEQKVNWENYFIEARRKIGAILKSLNSKTEHEWNFDPSPEELVTFRDSIGVLRISRRRFMCWIDWLAEEKKVVFTDYARERLQELVKILDKAYMLAEISRLKKNTDFSPILHLLKEVKQIEGSWVEELSRFYPEYMGEHDE